MTRPHGSVTCEVWWATPSDRAELAELLDDAEHRRAERLRRPGDRARFVTARALLRLLLTARTGAAPAEHLLDTTCHRCGADHGKPRLIGDRICFSIAHSGRRVVVAVTEGAALGVDVESVAHRGVEELSALTGILGPAELADYERLARHARERALAVWWTRKEAVLKATGYGLSVPMRDMAVTPPSELPALRSVPGRGAAPMAALRDLSPGGGYVACVAALGPSLCVTERDGDDLLARGAPATTLP